MPPKFSLKGKSVWVAGETGMVGRAVVRALQGEDVQIISAPHKMLDLTNQQQTYDWLKASKPDVVIMAAGKVGGIGANKSKPASFMYENLSMAQNVIHGAYQADISKLLYLGSSCIYPKFANQPIAEEALLEGALEPTNEGYALAKIMGLKLCEFYRSQYGCDFISAMPTNLYGENDHFNAQQSHVIPALIFKMHQAKINDERSVILWGTGTPLREFLYVDDLARGLIHLIKNYSDAKTVNIGTGKDISINDLAIMIKKIVGFDGQIEFDTTKPDGTPRKFLDNSKMTALGWSPQMSLDEGLHRAYEWFLKSSTKISNAA